MKRTLCIASWIVLLTANAAVHAELRLPKMFTDHMVLQQGMPVAVWDWGDPNTKVSVAFDERMRTTSCDVNGRWRVDLPAAMADGVPHTLTVTSGAQTLECKNVLLGEVWICGGQSNMGRPVSGEQVKSAGNAKIRLFNISGSTPRPDDVDDTFGWAICTSESIAQAGDGTREKGRRGFTEVGYVFGREIHERLHVPVGLIQMNCGGSTAKDWTPTPGVAKSLNFNEPLKKLTHKAGVLYEVRMRGMVPYTARGVVWYQGEDDGRNKNYAADFSQMIAAWRGLFGRDDLPFYFAQIAQTT